MTTGSKVSYEGIIAETVTYPGYSNDLIGGYMARPLGPGPYPGVLLIMEAFGLVTHTKEQARKFAAAGYVTIAPDLFSREGPVDPADMRAVMAAMGGTPDSRAIGDFEGAAQVLKSFPTCNGKIGAIGHCSGGRHSLLFACNTDSLNAAVSCYGGRIIQDEPTEAAPVAVVNMIERLSCPLLGLFGEEDINPNPEHVAKIESELKKHKKVYEFHTYPNAGHGFFADYRPSYRQEAAVDGWERILAWFDKYLK